MSEELWSITLVMTDRQLRHLRQACIDYAEALHEGRLAGPPPGCTKPSRTEIAAYEVERRVFRACDLKFPMGRAPEEAVQ